MKMTIYLTAVSYLVLAGALQASATSTPMDIDPPAGAGLGEAAETVNNMGNMQDLPNEILQNIIERSNPASRRALSKANKHLLENVNEQERFMHDQPTLALDEDKITKMSRQITDNEIDITRLFNKVSGFKFSSIEDYQRFMMEIYEPHRPVNKEHIFSLNLQCSSNCFIFIVPHNNKGDITE